MGYYEDLFEELSKYGEIESLNVYDNMADHMEKIKEARATLEKICPPNEVEDEMKALQLFLPTIDVPHFLVFIIISMHDKFIIFTCFHLELLVECPCIYEMLPNIDFDGKKKLGILVWRSNRRMEKCQIELESYALDESAPLLEEALKTNEQWSWWSIWNMEFKGDIQLVEVRGKLQKRKHCKISGSKGPELQYFVIGSLVRLAKFGWSDDNILEMWLKNQLTL